MKWRGIRKVSTRSVSTWASKNKRSSWFVIGTRPCDAANHTKTKPRSEKQPSSHLKSLLVLIFSWKVLPYDVTKKSVMNWRLSKDRSTGGTVYSRGSLAVACATHPIQPRRNRRDSPSSCRTASSSLCTDRWRTWNRHLLRQKIRR
jgi:hypothetical protein